MNAVIVVGLATGGVIVLVTLYIMVRKKDFPLNGLAALLLGFLAIGLSVFKEVEIKAGIVEVRLNAMIAEVTRVMEQTTKVAEEVAVTRKSVARIAQIQPQTQSIATTLAVTPTFSVDTLRAVQERVKLLQRDPRATGRPPRE